MRALLTLDDACTNAEWRRNPVTVERQRAQIRVPDGFTRWQGLLVLRVLPCVLPLREKHQRGAIHVGTDGGVADRGRRPLGHALRHAQLQGEHD